MSGGGTPSFLPILDGEENAVVVIFALFLLPMLPIPLSFHCSFHFGRQSTVYQAPNRVLSTS